MILSFAFFSAPAFALSIPDKPQHYVNDYIGLLSPESRQRVENTLTEFEKATSNQVVVAIFDSLEGGSLEDFSIHLAEKWKVGQKDKSNGVILLIFKSDRKVRIEVGYGLEGALPDVIANQIIQNEIVPNFRAGNYDAGVERAVASILQATKGEYKAAPVNHDEKIKSKGSLFMAAAITYFFAPLVCYFLVAVLCSIFLGFPAGLIAAIAIILVLAGLRAAVFSSSFGSTYAGRGGGYWGGGFGRGGFSGGGGFGGGGGGGFGGGGSSGSW